MTDRNKTSLASSLRALAVVGIAGLAVCSLALTAGATPAAEGDSRVNKLDREAYSVITTGKEIAAGDDTFTVEIKAKAGHKVNEEYPTKLKLALPPEGLELPKQQLKKADGTMAEDKKTFTFAVPLKGTKPGTYTVAGEVKFSVCNDRTCLLKKERVTAQVTVK